jgi:hypothetical protein
MTDLVSETTVKGTKAKIPGGKSTSGCGAMANLNSKEVEPWSPRWR